MGQIPENSLEASRKARKHTDLAQQEPTITQLHENPFYVTFCQHCITFDFSLGIGTVTTITGKRFSENFLSALVEFIDF